MTDLADQHFDAARYVQACDDCPHMHTMERDSITSGFKLTIYCYQPGKRAKIDSQAWPSTSVDYSDQISHFADSAMKWHAIRVLREAVSARDERIAELEELELEGEGMVRLRAQLEVERDTAALWRTEAVARGWTRRPITTPRTEVDVLSNLIRSSHTFDGVNAGQAAEEIIRWGA